MKALTVGAIATVATANVTKEEWLFIISVIITVLNLVAEFMRSRTGSQKEKTGN